MMLQRVRPYTGVFLVLAGGALAWLMSPLDWFDGYCLFFLGMAAGEWNGQINPRDMRDRGPEMVWDEMYPAERMSYFFLPVAFVVAGLLALVMAMDASRMSTQWGMIGSALAVIGAGLVGVFSKWSHRYS